MEENNKIKKTSRLLELTDEENEFFSVVKFAPYVHELLKHAIPLQNKGKKPAEILKEYNEK